MARVEMLGRPASGHFTTLLVAAQVHNAKSDPVMFSGFDRRMHDIGRPARFLGQQSLQGSHSDLAVLSQKHLRRRFNGLCKLRRWRNDGRTGREVLSKSPRMPFPWLGPWIARLNSHHVSKTSGSQCCFDE